MNKSISGYDIIGDIHGHAEELITILQKMGYILFDGVWSHPERKAIFVGDYIDRGPDIRQALEIVKSMVDAGEAFAIMGNHEYNALAFAYQLPNGEYLRKHSAKNIIQHYETIKQFQNDKQKWDDYLNWFATLPLFLEIEGLRIVHAYWKNEHIEYLKGQNSPPLTQKLLVEAHVKDTKMWKVFEEVLKGEELKLPDGCSFEDKDGHKRTECRSKWWMNTEGLMLKDYLFDAPPFDNGKKVPSEYKAKVYDPKDPFVFFGHYWLSSTIPQLQASNVCCLDYSVAKKGLLVAYRYYFVQPNNDDNFVTVNARK